MTSLFSNLHGASVRPTDGAHTIGQEQPTRTEADPALVELGPPLEARAFPPCAVLTRSQSPKAPHEDLGWSCAHYGCSGLLGSRPTAETSANDKSETCRARESWAHDEE